MYIDEANKIPYIFEAWQKQVANRPNEVFLVDVANNIKFTLKQSDEISGKVYAYLKDKKIGKDDFVLINLPRGASTILAMIGVWKAGAAFVVTEDTLAPERIEYIKKDCSCKLTIDNDVWEQILEFKPYLGYVKCDNHNAAFAVYTSGSTGNPKGVLHEFGSLKLLEYSAKWNESFFDEPVVNYGMFAPLNFVASVMIVVLRIYKLTRLFILPYSIIKNPVKLLDCYKTNQIYSGYLPPSYIRVLGDKIKDYMKFVSTGSEPANGIYVEGVKIVNNYSMSEVPTLISNFVIDKKYDVVPIGKINNGIPFYLIDEDGNEIKDDSIGELCFAVPFTRGYINLPEQTKKAFINGIYHTGDLAHRLPDGNYVLDGRSNDTIKINGNRIEPAEIEAAFKKITGVHWCAAKGIQEKRRSYVCLYYNENIDFDEEATNKKMQNLLPSYMIPAYYMKIKDIPLKATGKMDRKSLPIPEINNFRNEYIAPRDDLEKIICEAFAKALNIPSDTISIKDDFYKLGGDSIGTMLVVTKLDSINLSAKDIFKCKTIEKLADLVRERNINQTESLDKQLENELFVPHKLNAMQVKIFDYQLYKVNGTMWNLPIYHRYDKSVNAEKLKNAVLEVVKAHPALSCIIKFNNNNELVFEYKPELNPEIDINYSSEEEMQEIEKELIKPFKMLKSPLFRCFIFETEKNIYLFFDMHHIIGDGTTISVILRDIEKAYFDEKLNNDYYLLELARIERNKDKLQPNKEYFDNTYSGIEWYSIPEPDFKSRDSLEKIWNGKLSVTGKDVTKAENKYLVTRNAIAIAAGLYALSKYSENTDVLTNWIYSNRTTKASEDYVGLMIKTLPVGIRMDEIKNNIHLLNAVKDQINEGIQNCDYDYFTEYESVFNTDCMEINYVGNLDFDSFGKRLKYDDIKLTRNDSNATARLEIELWDGVDENVSLEAFYLAKIYKEESINRFMKLYSDSFIKLVKGVKLYDSDYEIVEFNENTSNDDIKILNEIYIDAFSEKERIYTLDYILQKCLEDERLKTYIMYDDPLKTGKKQVVAFCNFIMTDDYIYGTYFGIKKEFKSRYYGTYLIEYIMEDVRKDRHLFFNASMLEDTPENQEERMKRKKFYHRMGINIARSGIIYNGITYDFYSLKELTPEELDMYIELFSGDFSTFK